MRTASRLNIPARPLAAAVRLLAIPVLFVPFLVVPVLAAGPALAAQPAVPAAGSSLERFTLIGHQADGSGQQVRAAGVLSARGYAEVTAASPRRSVTRLVFARGSLRLVTYPKRRSASAPDPSSCRFTEVVHGDYAVRGGGQQYRHATGSGVYVTRIVGHLKQEHGGGCGSQLARFWQRTRTWGSLRW
jgi:hypothetical protein